MDEATPPGLTLFSVGWPPYCEAGDVEELFSRAGTVTSAIFQERPGVGVHCVRYAPVVVIATCITLSPVTGPLFRHRDQCGVGELSNLVLCG